MWLELLEGLWGIVNEGEAGGLAATVLGLETEDVDLVLGALVQLSELATEVVLGHVGAVWVQDVTVVNVLALALPTSNILIPFRRAAVQCIPRSADRVCDRWAGVWMNLHDHLLAAQKRVADELARSQRNGLLAVGHVDGM